MKRLIAYINERRLLIEGDSTHLNIWRADNSTLVVSFKIIMDQRTTRTFYSRNCSAVIGIIAFYETTKYTCIFLLLDTIIIGLSALRWETYFLWVLFQTEYWWVGNKIWRKCSSCFPFLYIEEQMHTTNTHSLITNFYLGLFSTQI